MDQEEVISFLKSHLEKDEIIGFYFDYQTKRFIVKLVSESVAHKYTGLAYQHFFKSGRERKVRLMPADDFVHVIKLYNVPYEIDRSMVKKALESYGRVLSIENELCEDSSWSIANGNIIACMHINDSIPTRINIAGYTLKIFSSSLERVCFLCGAKDHTLRQCTREKLKNTADHASSSKSTEVTNGKKIEKPIANFKLSDSNDFSKMMQPNLNSINSKFKANDESLTKNEDDVMKKLQEKTKKIEKPTAIPNVSTDDTALKRFEDL